MESHRAVGQAVEPALRGARSALLAARVAGKRAVAPASPQAGSAARSASQEERVGLGWAAALALREEATLVRPPL